MPKKTDEKKLVGIHAYGSLISNPGREINCHRSKTIYNVDTSFPVEFARRSGTRNKGRRKGAPTLVPFKGGGNVTGQVFVMNLCLEETANVLFRRELHKVGNLDFTYPEGRGIELINVSEHNRKKYKKDDVYIKIEPYSESVTLLCTSISDNMGFTEIEDNKERYAECLACNAIISVFYAEPNFDGISYLNDAIGNGIRTVLSGAYKKAVLELTKSKCLCQAIEHAKRLQDKNDIVNVLERIADNEIHDETERSDCLDEVRKKLKSIF